VKLITHTTKRESTMNEFRERCGMWPSAWIFISVFFLRFLENVVLLFLSVQGCGK
jgi:hypothetical protein